MSVITSVISFTAKNNGNQYYKTMHWLHTFCRTQTAQGMATAVRITFFFLFLNLSVAQNVTESGTGTLSVGVILNLQSLVGKMARISILMAMEDFYAVHRNYSTKLVLHIRDSNGDDIQAASEGTFYNL